MAALANDERNRIKTMSDEIYNKRILITIYLQHGQSNCKRNKKNKIKEEYILRVIIHKPLEFFFPELSVRNLDEKESL